MNPPEDNAALKARIVKAEGDVRAWEMTGIEEKYLEAESLIDSLEGEFEARPPPARKPPMLAVAARSNAMLKSLSHLTASSVTATDGAIGHVRDAFFDDQSWTIRYLVVDTGSWMPGNEVLISPYAVRPPLGAVKNIEVSLTRRQVEHSPSVDTHQSISRQHERELHDYYAYPPYWIGGGLWGVGVVPSLPVVPPFEEQQATRKAMKARDIAAGDTTLRSSIEVSGYNIQVLDGSIGHINDFIFDEDSWTIRYLLVHTHNWWPGGHKVLIGTAWIAAIDWETRMVKLNLTREQIKTSPPYDDTAPITRDYEDMLHDAYKLESYWD